MFAPPLKVIVGTEKKEFYISRFLICQHSEFFKAASSDRWESGRTDTVILERDDAKTFGFFLTWLVSGDVASAADFRPIHARQGNLSPEARGAAQASTEAQGDDLIQCYILGDMLQAPSFCNHIIDVMLLGCKVNYQAFTCLESIGYAFSNTLEGSPLRHLLVDNYLAGNLGAPARPFSTVAGLAEFYHQLAHQAMVIDLEADPVEPWSKGSCYYHTPTDRPGTCSCPVPISVPTSALDS